MLSVHCALNVVAGAWIAGKIKNVRMLCHMISTNGD